ncbi:hypothetical protein AB6Q56_12850 [Dechloromonas sp. ARDL1]|uniref:hypothetical protein n=1 Tax=Dechloromonas sp. ARDL1 TaxID=3322121 RepID=UPI003DA6F1A8
MRRFVLPLLLALSGVANADSPPLGRLFYDAQQRTHLDQQRQRNPWFGQQPQEETENALTLNGEVRSSSGRRTRWINGAADWNNTSPTPSVPVGNTYYPESGQTDSLLGGGRITVKPGR